jgi:hypothetical protein
MFSSLFLFASIADAAPLEVLVTDPAAHAVVVRCGNRVEREPVRDGVATFDFFPNDCVVDVIVRKGEIHGPGTWTCSDQGCVLQQVDHLPITSGPGQLNIVLSGDHGGNLVGQIDCPSGHKTRANIERNTLIFTGVPNETCVVSFRGGGAVQSPKLAAGDWLCNIEDQPTHCQPLASRSSTP